MWGAVVLNGERAQLTELQKLAEHCSYVIAADGGANWAFQAGIELQQFVGDEDSIEAASQAYLKQKRVPKTVYPTAKDFTDSHLAIQELARRLSWPPQARGEKQLPCQLPGANGMILLAALGERWDHVLANIFLAQQYVRPNFPILLSDGYSMLWLLQGPCKMNLSSWDCTHKANNRYFSLVPLTTEVQGLQLKGARWELHETTLLRGASQGISNEFRPGLETELEFANGDLLLVITSEPARN